MKYICQFQLFFFLSWGLFENLGKALDHLQGDKIGMKIYTQF